MNYTHVNIKTDVEHTRFARTMHNYTLEKRSVKKPVYSRLKPLEIACPVFKTAFVVYHRPRLDSLLSELKWSDMFRIIALVASLFCLWLLMSGIYKPLIIGFGLFSSVLSAWIVHRLGLLKHSLGFFAELQPVAFIRYLFWLLIEIGKADWAVTKTILSPQLPKNQRDRKSVV